MSFLGPAWLLLTLIAAPIILIWFLRQRREPRTVPTIFLWRRAMDEERVAPIIRRLTRSILLLLQLLALLLIVFAAAGAVLNLALSGKSRRVILLIDRSASMGTLEQGGATRLALARAKVRDLIGTLRGDDRAMLIVFDSSARILTGFTNDERRVLSLLDRIRPTDLPTALDEALAVAAAAAATQPPDGLELFLFSDGAFPPVADLPESLSQAGFHFVGVGKETENGALISLELDLGLDAPKRVYVQVANPGRRPQRRTLRMEKDGQVIDRRAAELSAGSTAGTAFDLEGLASGIYTVTLEPKDAYAADDQVTFMVADAPVHRVLVVTSKSRVLARLSDFHPTVEVYALAPEAVGSDAGRDVGGFELTIFDGVVPEGVAPGTGYLGPAAVYLNCAPPGEGISFGALLESPTLVDWDGAHPLNRSVSWSDVLVANASPIDAGREASVLLEATEGPLIVALPGTALRIVTGFSLEDSNFTLRLAFPIFFANIMERAFRGGATEGGFVPTGGLLVRRAPPGTSAARIVDPEGHRRDLALRPGRKVTFAETSRAGVYQLEFDGPAAVTAQVPVAFLSREESDIAPRPAIEISGRAKTSNPQAVRANLPLRNTLLYAALVVLMAEWLLWILRGRQRPLPKAGI